jgi:hypothetical protein
MVRNVFGSLPTDDYTKFKLGFRALHQHELFHFATDYMAAQWECILSRPCKRPADKALKTHNGYFLFEEELANVQMLNSFRYAKKSLSVTGKTEALKRFIAQQPDGYCYALEYNNIKMFDENCSDLCKSYAESIPGYGTHRIDGVDVNNLFPRFPLIDWRYCPIHIVHDEHRLNLPAIYLDLFRNITTVTETDDFLKKLRKLSSDIQNAWKKIRSLLQITTTAPGLDFKLWKRFDHMDIFSVRLNKSYRAHLGYVKSSKSWLAIAVGGHKEMGHG